MELVASLSNGTRPEEDYPDIFLPVLSVCASLFLLVLSLLGAIALTNGIVATGFFLTTNPLPMAPTPPPNTKNVYCSGVCSLIILSGIISQCIHPPESFLAYVVQNWEAMYGFTIVACFGLSALGLLKLAARIIGRFTTKTLEDDNTERTTTPVAERKSVTDAKLLLLVTVGLALTGKALSYAPWTPQLEFAPLLQVLGEVLGYLKPVGIFVARSLAFIAVPPLVCLSTEVTAMLVRSISNGHWNCEFSWTTPGSQVSKDAPWMLGFCIQVGFWPVNVWNYWGMEVEWSLLQLLFFTAMLEVGVLASAVMCKGCSLIVPGSWFEEEVTKEEAVRTGEERLIEVAEEGLNGSSPLDDID